MVYSIQKSVFMSQWCKLWMLSSSNEYRYNIKIYGGKGSGTGVHNLLAITAHPLQINYILTTFFYQMI